MNCEDFGQRLSQGGSLDEAAREHCESCVGCRRMMRALEAAEASIPDAGRLEAIQAQLAEGLQPVRPLPSDGQMAAWGLAAFVLLAAASLVFGYRGFEEQSVGQRWAYFGTIGAAAVLLTGSAIQQMVPGARRNWNPALLTLSCVCGLAALVYLLFGTTNLATDTVLGIPCFAVGLLCTTVGGLAGYLLVRQGYALSPMRAGLVTGGLAGLTGVVVLAVHCPILEAGHIIVWHIGPMVIGGLAGAAAGGWWSRSEKRRGSRPEVHL